MVEELLSEFSGSTNKYGIIAAAYDTELFGHWWFEGVEWLGEVLKRFSRSNLVEITTATEYVNQHPPEDVLPLHEGSWGQAGNHFTWMNSDTGWMWPIVHEVEYKMEALVRNNPDATGKLTDILNQAARELLLLQSSDWPFLVTTGQAAAYSIECFNDHVDRFNKLSLLAEQRSTDEQSMQYCREMQELDSIFPDINYRSFAAKEPV